MTLSMEEKLRIANTGGQFQANEYAGWVGKKIRKGNRKGIVVSDMNGAIRTITVRFDDGIEEKIHMNNLGEDFDDNSAYEWLCGEEWYRF